MNGFEPSRLGFLLKSPAVTVLLRHHIYFLRRHLSQCLRSEGLGISVELPCYDVTDKPQEPK